MQFSLRASRRRGLLGAIAGCSALMMLFPGPAVRAATANIEVRNKGKVYRNFNTGTEVWEQDVTLRQAPDTLIRADKAEGRNLIDGYDDGHWTLSGSVHIEFEGAVLDARSATVVFADGRIRSIVVQGQPARFSHPAGNAGQRNEGRAGTISYDGTIRQVRFAGHTAYAFGPYEGTADKPLLYSLDSTGISSEEVPDDDSRIMFTFRNMQASARTWRANIRNGTQELEQDVQLRRAPDTLIQADKAEGSKLSDGYHDGQWKLTGNVQIDHDEAALSADAAAVTFAGGEVRSMLVSGIPARFSFPTRTDGQRFEGSAESVTFDGVERMVRVTGHPSRYSFGVNPFSSDKPLVYAMDAGVLRSEDTGDADARIRGELNPASRVPTPRMPDRGSAQ